MEINAPTPGVFLGVFAEEQFCARMVGHRPTAGQPNGTELFDDFILMWGEIGGQPSHGHQVANHDQQRNQQRDQEFGRLRDHLANGEVPYRPKNTA
jgi:hypothetical protein